MAFTFPYIQRLRLSFFFFFSFSNRSSEWDILCEVEKEE